MAFIASNTIPADAYQRVKRAAVNLKQNCQSFNTQLAATGANYTFLRDIYITLKNADSFFETMKATPGLAAYAKAQEDNAAYDVAAEFTAMQATVQAAMAWMQANVPTNVTAVAPADWTQTGTLIATTFTPAQTANLRTALTAVVNAIS